MPRDRFLQIFWNLHLCDPISPLQRRSQKVQPLLDLLCPRFSAAFKLGALDEAIVAFRGKPHPFGIKAFVLADSETGVHAWSEILLWV